MKTPDRLAALLAALPLLPLFAESLEYQAGLLRREGSPSADFGTVFYRHRGYRIGVYSSPAAQGVVASYSSGTSPFVFEVGQRERSLDNGFLVSNGAWLPWTRNFAFGEPVGIRTGYATRYLSADVQYYQNTNAHLAATRAWLTPAAWFALGGGVALPNIEQDQKYRPLATLGLGRRDDGFYSSLEFVGVENYLLHARYTGSGNFSLRSLWFRRGEFHPLTSGIYQNREGFAAQFFLEHWFAQYFATTSRFGMLRYHDGMLTGVVVYEERMQLAGLSLRSHAQSLHARVGASFGHDGSMQTLAGLGFQDLVFVGLGHFELFSEQPLEPIIFPAAWYTSVLLQSTGMRIRHRGFKLMALIDTEVVQGFFAVVHSHDLRGRERFDVYLRLAGGVHF